jgi:ABC-type transport system involved in multi-copper enzyme maturation permease subunit
MPVFLRWLLRLGPTNPIAVRLVQNGSRRVKHMYIRSGYLAVLIIVLLWMLLFKTSAGDLDYRKLAEAGAVSFTIVAYLQITLICILAPVFMGGAIAQEADPRTWEVLLTTPMTQGQIVLGNLFGRLFFVLALLFASLPLFAMTQYFGGVPGRAIFASYGIAAAAALLVGSIAISLSVSRLAGKRAFFVFYVAIVSYLAVTIGVDNFLRTAGQGVGGRGVTWMTALNPFLSLHALLNPSTYVRAPLGSQTGLASWFLEKPVQTWCYGSVILSFTLLTVSTITVRAGGWAGLTGDNAGVPWYRRLFGLGAAGAEHRPPRSVWHNPIAWREAAARNATLGRIVARWAFIAMGLAFAFVLVWAFHVGRLAIADFQLAMLATVWGELAVTALVAINMAATAVSREREDGTLDILLTTPITPATYLSGKLRGLIAYILPMLAVPLFTLALASVYVLFGGFERTGGVYTRVSTGTNQVDVPAILPEAAILAPVVFIPFMAFCIIVGLQWSLKSKGTIGSVVATVGVVGAISGVVGLCGWRAASDIAVVGPVLGAMSPASLTFAFIRSRDAMLETVAGPGNLGSARLSLAVGCAVSAAVYVGIVYAIHANMVRTFDMTVRRLAGTR